MFSSYRLYENYKDNSMKNAKSVEYRKHAESLDEYMRHPVALEIIGTGITCSFGSLQHIQKTMTLGNLDFSKYIPRELADKPLGSSICLGYGPYSQTLPED